MPTERIKANTSNRLLVGLVILSIFAIATLVFMHQIILASLYNNSSPGESVDAPILLDNPYPTSNKISIVPLTEVEFKNKYASTYNGHLPSEKWLLPDPSCGTDPEFSKFFQLSEKHRSRFKEDQIIYNSFFKNKDIKGTYVELGAFDGTTESNTRFFDLCLGWEGLLIEALPQSYAKVLKNRPHATRLSFSPTCQDINSTVNFHNKSHTNTGLEGVTEVYKKNRRIVSIPCGPITPVLLDVFGPGDDDEDHNGGGGAITFFSLDVESAESLVLDTLDFSKIGIDVMMIEVINSFCKDENCPNVLKIREAMKLAGGYEIFKRLVPNSYVYVRHSFLNKINWNG